MFQKIMKLESNDSDFTGTKEKRYPDYSIQELFMNSWIAEIFKYKIYKSYFNDILFVFAQIPGNFLIVVVLVYSVSPSAML